MTSIAPVEVRNTWIEITTTGPARLVGTGGTPALTDIKIIDMDTDQVVAGPIALNLAAATLPLNSGTLQFTDDYTIGSTRNLGVTADISRTEDVAGEFVGGTYQVTLGDNTADTIGPGAGVMFAGGADVKYQDTNDYVAGTDIVPNTPIVGNGQTVQQAMLMVDVSSYIGASTHVKGAQDAAAAAFVMTAGTDSDIRTDRIILNPTLDSSGAGLVPDGTFAGLNDVTANNVAISCDLWEITGTGWVHLSGPEAIQVPLVGGVPGPPGTETLTFNGFETITPAGDSTVYAVSFDASTSFGYIDGAVFDTAIVFDINAGANIRAYDEDDNLVTPGLNATPLLCPVASVLPVGVITLSADNSDSVAHGFFYRKLRHYQLE